MIPAGWEPWAMWLQRYGPGAEKKYLSGLAKDLDCHTERATWGRNPMERETAARHRDECIAQLRAEHADAPPDLRAYIESLSVWPSIAGDDDG